MKTHRVTVELSDFAYNVMQRMLQEDGFSSESEVLDSVLCEMHIQEQENARNPLSPWSPEEADAIIAEADADPNGWLTIQQVEEHFARKDATLVEAA